MRVLVFGGRDFTDMEGGMNWVMEALATIPLHPPEKGEVVFISGCARGADQIPILLTKEDDEWGGLIKFPADWDKHGKAAGPIRNKQMLDEGKPDLAIMFPGGRGTAHMKGLLDKAGVEVWRAYV